jgi:hypothetical protein
LLVDVRAGNGTRRIAIATGQAGTMIPTVHAVDEGRPRQALRSRLVLLTTTNEALPRENTHGPATDPVPRSTRW